MERHIKWQPGAQYASVVKPGTMRFLEFGRLQLDKGQQHSWQTGDREYVMDFFAGAATVTVTGQNGDAKNFTRIGGRASVFSGPPVMLYIPPRYSYTISADSEALDVGVFSAASAAKIAPALLEGSQVLRNEVGRDNWRRTVYSALGDNVAADRLIAGETLNPPGNWSSYPPHKHDRSDPPQEAVLEEIYFFRIQPPQGFALMWTYTAAEDPDGFSTIFKIEDGDTVLLPKGYHPVVAAPGYQVHYTWVLAGEERRYGAWSDDPEHSWVKETVKSDK
jgi:5-deoxy-glucuronate isomerase